MGANACLVFSYLATALVPRLAATPIRSIITSMTVYIKRAFHSTEWLHPYFLPLCDRGLGVKLGSHLVFIDRHGLVMDVVGPCFTDWETAQKMTW